jgi:hypothetical protein
MLFYLSRSGWHLGHLQRVAPLFRVLVMLVPRKKVAGFELTQKWLREKKKSSAFAIPTLMSYNKP